MSKEELAEALYNLIVVRGRWHGQMDDNETYATLPEWAKELWLARAVEFAFEHSFRLTD